MNKIEQILNTLRKEMNETSILSKEERFRIRAHALGEEYNKPIISPVEYFPKVFFMNYASMTALFLFVFTGTLTYVAEQSLPGDALYSVKTQINENIQSLLTFSPESKAKLEATLAEKRLNEAQKLAASSKLSSSTEIELADGFKKHTDQFKKSVSDLDSKNPSAAADITSDFQTDLMAHQSSLSGISTMGTISSSTTNTIEDLGKLRERVEKSLALLSPDILLKITTEKYAVATSTIETFASSTDERVTKAKTILEEGKTAFNDKRYPDAYVSFSAVLRAVSGVIIATTSSSTANLNNASSTATSTATTTDSVASSTATSTAPSN